MGTTNGLSGNTTTHIPEHTGVINKMVMRMGMEE
jgi:hypothetical protein